MCGRFVLASDLSQIAEEFKLAELKKSFPLPRGDVRPGQKSAGIIAEGNKKYLLDMLWGFSPAWPKQTPSRPLINARGETLPEKLSFQEPFRRGRCLIPADGFYEWSKDKKQFYFSLRSHSPFGLAGLYKQDSENSKELSFVIITTAPNKLIEPIHNRMPAIIPVEKQSLWLDSSAFEKTELMPLLNPYPENEMEMRPGPYRL